MRCLPRPSATGHGRDRGKRCLLLLLLLACEAEHRSVAQAAQLFSSGSCNAALGVASPVTGSTQCGARVDLNSPYAAAPGSVRVGFALSETLPVLSVVQVFLPDVASPFIFSSGGASQAEGLVTAAGDEQVAPMHGMGAPTLSVERVASGTLATVILGEIRQPTLADSEAGFQFNITNVGNPYAGPNRRDRLHRHMCASDSHECVSYTRTGCTHTGRTRRCACTPETARTAWRGCGTRKQFHCP